MYNRGIQTAYISEFLNYCTNIWLLELSFCHLHLWKHSSTNSEMIWPIKAKVNTATSARKENCRIALPQIEMSGPFSTVEGMYKHKSAICPAPAFCFFKPMHHKQTERDALYGLLLVAHHAADTATAQHHYKYDRGHAKWQLKTRTNCPLIDKSDWFHAQTWEEKQRIRLKQCQGQHRLLTEHRGKTDAG